MANPCVVFDLDGTLVNSAHGILVSIRSAFDSVGEKPQYPLTPELIGPPLNQILRLLCHDPEVSKIEELSDSFKAHYDSLGFQQTFAYPGVSDMLSALDDAEISLHIATNKRHRPTLRILQALGWAGYFDHVISLDSYTPPLPSKAAILAQLLTEANLAATDCLYIGDRLDDYNAAKAIGIPFALAAWGFEEKDTIFGPDTIRLETPNANQILKVFSNRQSSRA